MTKLKTPTTLPTVYKIAAMWVIDSPQWWSPRSGIGVNLDVYTQSGIEAQRLAVTQLEENIFSLSGVPMEYGFEVGVVSY